jgi:hypothetical protein
MKRTILFFSLFVGFIICLSANDTFIPKDLWADRGGIVFDFQGNNVTRIHKTEGALRIEKGVFKIEYNNNVPFLVINWQGAANKYLMLANENKFMLLYDRDGVDPLYTLFYAGKGLDSDSLFVSTGSTSVGSVGNITASSTLTDNITSYPPGNISNLSLNKAWAEGVSGHGINETVSFNRWGWPLAISIGYVSYSRPELYTANSRPKRIRVTSAGKSKEVTLRDTPAYQTIDLSGLPTSYESIITIQILEVYPGIKYQDTCINSIVTAGSGG